MMNFKLLKVKPKQTPNQGQNQGGQDGPSNPVCMEIDQNVIVCPS